MNLTLPNHVNRSARSATQDTPIESVGTPGAAFGTSRLTRPRIRRYFSSYGHRRIGDLTWILQPVLRLVVGGAFIVAGTVKILNPLQFAHDVENFRLLPHALTHVVAVLLPSIELVAGSLVLAGVWMRSALILLLGMLGVFLMAVSSALLRGLNIECGCFGTVGGRHIGWVTLAIDLGLTSAAVMLLWMGGRQMSGRRVR
jgi:uncharacterized membrane protein YphA (DoxX/SURF4 family)